MANFRIRKAVGGKVEGPSHESGGVPVTSKGLPATEPGTGRQYEIEGGERVFSVEDTQEMERIAKMIDTASPDKADELMKHLGKRVNEMLKMQDGGDIEQDVFDAGATAGDVPNIEPNEFID